MVTPAPPRRSHPGVDSRTRAVYIATHLPFDRLYFYGPERPLHVSVGPATSPTTTAARNSHIGRPTSKPPNFLTPLSVPPPRPEPK